MNFLKKRVTTIFGVLACSFALQTAYCDQPISRLVIDGASGPAGVKNGIAFNSSVQNGNLIYGASTNDSKIYILNANNGQIVDVFGPDSNIIGPDDIVVTSDSDGNVFIYYADTLGGFVGKVDVTNRVTSRITPTGALPLVNGIAMSDDGEHIYAATCFIPAQTGIPNVMVDINLANNNIVTPYFAFFGPDCAMDGAAFKDGAVYGAQVVTGDIFRVSNLGSQFPNVENVVAGTFNPSGCSNGPFLTSPSAVKFDSQGRLFITDSFDNKLYRVDNPTQNCQVPVEVGQLPFDASVDNLAFDPNGRLFVSSLGDGYIARINEKNGNSKNFLADAGLVLPCGVAAVGNNTVLVGDNSSLRIVDAQTKKIDGTTYESIPGFLDGTGIISPYTVSLFDSQTAVLSDFLENAIQIYNWVTDTAVVNISTSPFAPVNNPYGAPVNAVRFPTSATDPTPSVVAVQDSTSTFQSHVVQYSQGNNNYQTPNLLATIPGILTGMATDGTNIYIAEYITGTIFTININAPTVAIPIASGFSSPQGLALDGKGHLLIVETGVLKRLVSLDLSNLTNPAVVIEDNIPVGAANALFFPLLLNSVSVAPDTGDIFYTANGARQLRVISNSSVKALLGKKQVRPVPKDRKDVRNLIKGF